MPLHFLVGCRTNRSEGSWPGQAVGDLLSLARAEFGSAITDIEVILHVIGRVTIAEAQIRAMHPYLPAHMITQDSMVPALRMTSNARFERSRKKLVVNWASYRVEPNEGFSFSPDVLTTDLYERTFSEVFDALDWALAIKIKRSDDFDPFAFMDWLGNERRKTWASDAALRADAAEAHEANKARYDSLDPWEKLDIDWLKLAANARDILNDPRDWSQGDDFSPHGNDTGADIWASWSEYSRCSPERASAALGVRVPTGPDDQDHIWWHWVEVHLALAFGHIKKKGSCPDALRAQTLAVIRAEKRRAAPLSDWKHRDDWLERLARYESILAALA